MNDETNQPEYKDTTVEGLARGVNNIDRMKVGAHLINLFNFAILNQANRVQWNANDMRCFAIAFAAVDQIKAVEQNEPANKDGPDTIQDLEAEVRRLGHSNVRGAPNSKH